MNRILVAALVLVVGCEKSKETCKAEVADLMQFLHSFDHEVPMISVGDDAHLVTRADLPKAKRVTPIVAIDGTTMSYQGKLVDASSLAERLAAAHEEIRQDIERGRVPRGEPPEPAALYVQIDGEVTWDRVVAAVVAGFDAGFTRPGFVFATPVTFQPPPRTWVDDRADEARTKNGRDGGELASDFAQVTNEIIKSCPALIEVYEAVAAYEDDDRAGTLIEATGPALLECNCGVDMPALRSLMWLIMSNPHPTGALEIELAKDGKPLELPAATTWSDASERLSAGARVWLVAK